MKTNPPNSRSIAITVAALLAALFISTSRSQAASGTLLNLSLIHGTSSYGQGISDSGRATGFSAGGYYAFRTDVENIMIDHFEANACVHDSLTNLISGGVTASIGYDIYQSGSNPLRVAGDCIPTGSHWQGFFYHEDLSTSPATKIGRLLSEPSGATESSARAVVAAGSDASHVVGYAATGGRFYAYYWLVGHDGSTKATNLGTTHLSTHTNSYALDTDGTRHVGYYNEGSESGNRGFLISGTNVSSLYAYSAGAALGISPSTGLIAGYYVQDGYTKPIFWRIMPSGSTDGTLLSLGGYSHGMARAVSDNGIIVGSLWNSASDEVACRWLTNGTVSTLNSIAGDANWNMTRANNINSASGKHTTGIMKNVSSGAVRAFMFYGW